MHETKLRLGVITKNVKFIYYLEDQLQVLSSIEILEFN